MLQELYDVRHDAVDPHESLIDELNAESNAKVNSFDEPWLVKINLYGNEFVDGNRAMWKHEGGTVLNFEADAVIPCYDKHLKRLIMERHFAKYTTAQADMKRIDAIFARIDELGGKYLSWA